MAPNLGQQLPSPVVFLADDDEDDIFLFTQAISDTKISPDISVSKDGRQLINNLSIIYPKVPDIVFLDINMPIMNGFECLQQVRSDYSPELPVFLLSTVYDEGSVNTARKLGATGFLTKTVCLPAFVQMLSDVLIKDWRGRTKNDFYIRLENTSLKTLQY